MANIKEAVDQLEINEKLKTLHGDLTQQILEEIKTIPHVWELCSEKEQDDILERCIKKSENIIRRSFDIVAQKSFDTCKAKVESVQFKDAIKVNMNSLDIAGAHTLADNTGQEVLIIFADANEYLGGGEFPKSEPDQRALELAS